MPSQSSPPSKPGSFTRTITTRALAPGQDSQVPPTLHDSRTAKGRRSVISVAEVARHRSTSRQAALTWLQRNMARHLRHTAAGWVVSRRAYMKLAEADAFEDFRKQLHDLRERVELLERGQRAHATKLFGGPT